MMAVINQPKRLDELNGVEIADGGHEMRMEYICPYLPVKAGLRNQPRGHVIPPWFEITTLYDTAVLGSTKFTLSLQDIIYWFSARILQKHLQFRLPQTLE